MCDANGKVRDQYCFLSGEDIRILLMRAKDCFEESESIKKLYQAIPGYPGEVDVNKKSGQVSLDPEVHAKMTQVFAIFKEAIKGEIRQEHVERICNVINGNTGGGDYEQ